MHEKSMQFVSSVIAFEESLIKAFMAHKKLTMKDVEEDMSRVILPNKDEIFKRKGNAFLVLKPAEYQMKEYTVGATRKYVELWKKELSNET